MLLRFLGAVHTKPYRIICIALLRGHRSGASMTFHTSVAMFNVHHSGPVKVSQ
jgi:hypothetical protein